MLLHRNGAFHISLSSHLKGCAEPSVGLLLLPCT